MLIIESVGHRHVAVVPTFVSGLVTPDQQNGTEVATEARSDADKVRHHAPNSSVSSTSQFIGAL